MLIDLYRDWRSRAPDQVLRFGELFYAPLLVRPPADWADCFHRIAYVGQETMGWGWTKEDAARFGYKWDFDEVFSLGDFLSLPSSVDALLESYSQFNFATSQPQNFNSPFWRYFRRLKDLVAADGKPTSALFTNVIRCAADNEAGFSLWTVPEANRQEFLGWQTGLLKAELALLNPTLIIFLSGPNYDRYLCKEFCDLEFEPLDTFSSRVAVKLSSSDLPAPAFRTYHPGYLNRSIGFRPLEAIAKTVR